MSKKKINNRLDKLFDEIKSNEAETQAERPRRGGRKPEQVTGLPSISTRSLDNVSEALVGIEMTLQTDDRLAPVKTQVSPTAMLSTAFRIDEKNWSTLKVVDETGKSTWGAEEQLLVKQVADQLSLAMENARLFQETQTSESELRALFSAMEDVIIIYDRNGRYERIAETNPNYLFRPSDEMLGRTLQEVLPENLHEPFLSTIRTALDTGQSQKIEYPLEINGAEYWFDASVSKLTENHVFWVARDITERKRAEEDLAKFKLGIENTNNAVFLTDATGAIQYINQGFKKIYGYTLDEVIGQTPRVLKSGLYPQEKYTELWEALLAKKTYSVEITNRAKDGRLVPVTGTYSPIIGSNDTILGFLAVQADITERKQNEEALRRQNEYLAASAEIGRLVTSSLDLKAIFSRAVNLVKERFGYYHAAIFIVEETGFNAVLQEATGEAGEQMKQQKHSLAVGSKSTVGQATETGNAIVINNTALDPIHKPNPLLPDTRSEAAIPLHIGNRIIGALDIQSTEVNAFSQDDVAILQLLADQIAIGIDNARSYNIAQQAVQEMREVDRLKSQFLANMSHELRTPLNSIIGFARVILKGIDGPVTELQQQDLTAIFNAGQHLLGLINDILDLSRIEAGKMELSFGEVNINDLITSVMSTAAGLIKDKPITLRHEVAADLPTVRADPMRIRQVLINLLSNAAKFTEKGEITVRAEVDDPATTGQSSVIVTVTDTGPGISPEDQDKLFQPFSQVDASLTRKAGGSGLGLSICHHLIQMHHGRIGVHSEPGRGSSFYFTIPVYVKEQKISTNGVKTILTIDDDPQILSLYERYLRPKGYQVIRLNDPARAKERVRQLRPFAVILDIMMPGYDGWRVLDDLKSDPQTRSIPVIICSILEEEEKGFSLGAADYMVKPIVEDDLLSSLDRLNNDGSIREVLIIDDDPNDLRLLGTMISNQGRYKPILAEGGQAGWNAIQSKTPHAIVLDLFMPDIDGFSLLERLHESNELRNIPVVVVSSSDLTDEQRNQLQMLGQKLLQKSSLQEQELIATIENALKRIDN